jgi:hypothetical protein
LNLRSFKEFYVIFSQFEIRYHKTVYEIKFFLKSTVYLLLWILIVILVKLKLHQVILKRLSKSLIF